MISASSASRTDNGGSLRRHAGVLYARSAESTLRGIWSMRGIGQGKANQFCGSLSSKR
jgi:hypothetical protein